MSAAAQFEAFVARLYVDAGLRARFARDPAGEARQFGLGEDDVHALTRVDLADLERAAASFAHKRARAPRRRSWWGQICAKAHRFLYSRAAP
jgi:hypothetical protein